MFFSQVFQSIDITRKYMSTAKSLLKWILRFVLLYVLFIIFFIIGSLAVAGVIPDNAKSEPGLVSPESGLLIIALVHLLIISTLIMTSRWSGWKLAISLAISYYGTVTFLMQIETWYFLSSITVGPALLLRLFLMGIPTAFLFIPIAVWVLGKGHPPIASSTNPVLVMSAQQWIGRFTLLALIYIVLYWCAGYFIAWQNPELRAFYGQPGEVQPFFTNTLDTLRNDPLFFLFQIFRALIWIACAVPIIRGSNLNRAWTMVLVGLFFSVPQNVLHTIANPLMPYASVRLSHMIETASSTFLFGVIVVWVLRRK